MGEMGQSELLLQEAPSLKFQSCSESPPRWLHFGSVTPADRPPLFAVRRPPTHTSSRCNPFARRTKCLPRCWLAQRWLPCASSRPSRSICGLSSSSRRRRRAPLDKGWLSFTMWVGPLFLLLLFFYVTAKVDEKNLCYLFAFLYVWKSRNYKLIVVRKKSHSEQLWW